MRVSSCSILLIISVFSLLLAACGSSEYKTDPEQPLVVVLPTKADFFNDVMADGSSGPKLVRLPAASFVMGCEQAGDCYDDDRPLRLVSIPKGLSLMLHEVSFAQYDTFAKATQRELPDDKSWGRGDRPVINVSWDDAVSYSEWLSEQTGQHYQLPTEAVWEYAARAGTTSAFFFGNDITQLCTYANVADSSEAKDRQGNPLIACDDGVGRSTALVGSYQANPFGLYDMYGNVREWVQDCYHDNYRNAPVDGSARVDGCNTEEMVLRGGAWFSFPWINSSFTRQSTPAYATSFSVGFRLMRIER
ncbi:formylglycine-generating enzyme family protein [Dasania marina]|uniref:formylglycine-generating enzyme family protein n=1 Tax=Dasania marina TaxID=471499 RepID=UPI0030D9BC4B|tara:strand:+ start:473 stop:1384 length:912 start_codon:yes stop_codon:yes gene_type:complete